MHRINTYPLVHLGWLHLLLNLIAWVPLSERFEREVGSAKMGGLVLGRESSFSRCDPGNMHGITDNGWVGGYSTCYNTRSSLPPG